MPKKKTIYWSTLILFFLATTIVDAQLEEKEFYYGFSAGVTKSGMSDVSTTLIRPIFSTDTYSISSSDRLGFTAGAFVYYKFKDSKFAIQPEINYYDGGGLFHYEDNEELSYDISFNYAHLQIAPIIKFYFAKGVHLAVGPQLGMILNRSSLKYTSNMPELGPDLQIQQSLRQVLKGNNNVSFVLGAGYDFTGGLGVNVRYQYGISDAMETLANGFYFIENKNSTNSISATLSYAIPFID